MTQPGAYVIPKLSDVYTSTEQMQNCFRTFFCKMYTNHFQSSQIHITVSYILWLGDLTLFGKIVVSFLRCNNDYFYK